MGEVDFYVHLIVIIVKFNSTSFLGQGRLVSPFSFGGGAPEPEKTKTRAKRQFGGNPMDLLSEIQLGCVGKKTKDDSCKKMTKEKGICVCTKELCNSASNAAPATFILLIWWIFAMIR